MARRISELVLGCCHRVTATEITVLRVGTTAGDLSSYFCDDVVAAARVLYDAA